MRFEQQVTYATATDIGIRRRNNEDACIARLCRDEAEFLSRGHLFVVADGMGGHAVGELASRLAVETVPHIFYKQKEGDARSALAASIVAANLTIHSRGTQNRDFQRMGTTCTSLVLTPRGALIGHVGDSRVYRVRRDRIDQLTFDHSLQWELRRSQRQLPEELQGFDNRNIITRSLGPERDVQVDFEGPHPVHPGDTYIVCSDGLTGQVTDEEIGGAARDLSPGQACRLLVHLANLRGGADNCTVIVVRIGELPANLSAAHQLPPDVSKSHVGWGVLAGFWLAAMGVVAGLSLLMFRYFVQGAVISGVGALWLLGLGFMAWLKSARAESSASGEGLTVSSRPHRTAVAKSSAAFSTSLSGVERELRKAAQEEGWLVGWETHQQTMSAAEDAIRTKRYGRAVREFARAIDLLMTDLPKRRATASALANASELL